ncbi:hypothetical protein YC2023_043125 [Brassica napus]
MVTGSYIGNMFEDRWFESRAQDNQTSCILPTFLVCYYCLPSFQSSQANSVGLTDYGLCRNTSQNLRPCSVHCATTFATLIMFVSDVFQGKKRYIKEEQNLGSTTLFKD